MLSHLVVRIFFIILTVEQLVYAGDICNLPIQNTYSIDRKSYIQDISKKLYENNFVIVIGPGGVGKTYFVEFYLQNYCQNQYDIIWKIDCTLNIQEQILRLIDRINKFYGDQKIENSGNNYFVLLEKIVKFTEKRGIKLLLFFDNSDNNIDFDYIADNSRKNKFRAILTSCSETLSYSKLKIDLFEKEESLEYLRNMLPFFSDSDLCELSETLNNYPISLYQAAWYLFKNRCINIQEYIQSYQRNLYEHWKTEESFLSIKVDKFKSVRSTMNISFTNIKSNKEICNNILISMAVMKDTATPIKTIIDIMKSYGYKKNRLEESISELVSNHHIEKNNDNSLSMHRIKQEAILYGDERIKIIKSHMIVSRYFLDILKCNRNNIIFFSNHNENFMDHVMSIIDKSSKIMQEDTSEITQLKIFLLDYLLYIRRDHQKAIKLIDIIYEEALKIDDIDMIARFLSSAGDVLHLHKLDSKISKEILRKMIKYLEDKKDHLQFGEVIRLCNSICQAYLLMGKPIHAEPYIKRSVDLIKHSKLREVIIPTCYFASWFYMETGNYELSINYLRKAVQLLQDSPNTAIKFYVYNNLSSSLLNIGQHEESLYFSKKSIEGCENYFGKFLSDTLAEAMAFHSEGLIKIGKHEEALELIRRSIDIYNKFYNSAFKIIDQARAWIIKGDALLKMDKINESHYCYIKAQNICNLIHINKRSTTYKNVLQRILFTSGLLKLKVIFNCIRDEFIHEFEEKCPPYDFYNVLNVLNKTDRPPIIN